jgi:hypothetical protein
MLDLFRLIQICSNPGDISIFTQARGEAREHTNLADDAALVAEHNRPNPYPENELSISRFLICQPVRTGVNRKSGNRI